MSDQTTTSDRQYVIELQTYLRRLAQTNSQIPLINVDGIFGPETAAAVTAFQTVSGLAPTGQVDLDTWNAIVLAYRRVTHDTAPPCPISPFPAPHYVIRVGDEGELVTVLQIMLDVIARPFSNIPSPAIIGRYDQQTEETVRSLQNAAEFPLTGEVDQNTWNMLAQTYNIFCGESC
ncbi:MAG: peptidoglycan-binding protein [Clostridiales bacterium]|nr:peptidoglycan-binding protein [Clostridiales bacterium]